MKFDRITLLILTVVSVVVFSATWELQRSMDNTQAVHDLTENQTVLAEQRVAATINNCQALNSQRQHQIAVSEAAIKAAAEAPPTFLTDQSRLLLQAFVQKTNREIEKVSPPKVCTVESLGLQGLADIARHP